MAKTKSESSSQRQVAVRLARDVFHEVEQHLARMRTESAAGVDLKLADALRNLVLLGLKASRG